MRALLADNKVRFARAEQLIKTLKATDLLTYLAWTVECLWECGVDGRGVDAAALSIFIAGFTR